MNKKSGKKTAVAVMAAVVFLMSIYCTVSRLPRSFSQEESLCMAAGLAMPVSNTVSDDSDDNNDKTSKTESLKP